jgi:phenylpropionate dioxygenase-like ring-hydroxylating dioxygenase large terminal subunit
MDLTATDDAWSLPAWIYADPECFAVEKEAIFRQVWLLPRADHLPAARPREELA